MKDTSAINYFEIPVTDMERAKKFYEAIFGFQLRSMKHEKSEFAIFPSQKIGGALAKGEGYTPSMSGIRCYLNAGEDLNLVLNRIENAGGKIHLTKTQISDHGFIARFSDTEGNLVALHSMN